MLSLILKWELWIWCYWFMCRRYQDWLWIGINNSKSQFFVVSPSLFRRIAVLLTRTKDPGRTSFQSVLSCVGTRDRKNNFLGWLIYLNTMKSWTAQLQVTTLCSGILICSVLVYSYVYWTVHHLYSCVKKKNQLDATYFIIYSILIHCSTCFGR